MHVVLRLQSHSVEHQHQQIENVQIEHVCAHSMFCLVTGTAYLTLFCYVLHVAEELHAKCCLTTRLVPSPASLQQVEACEVGAVGNA